MLKFFPDKKEVLAIMSEKEDGSMKIYVDNPNNINRELFLAKNNIDKGSVYSAEIIHSSCAEIVDKKSPQIIEGADALVTKEVIFLAVTIADCIPIYFFEGKKKIIGIAHAGWRGITNGIINNTLDKIIQLGGEMEQLSVILGPGLRDCHFEIKSDILDKFYGYSDFIIKKEGKIFIDLFGIIRKELLDYSVQEYNIFESGECTFCNQEKYFSYRRDKPAKTEAMMAVIGLNK